MLAGRDGTREKKDVRRRIKRDAEILKEAMLSNRESLIYIRSIRETLGWEKDGNTGRSKSRVVLLENTVIGCVAGERREMNSEIRGGSQGIRAVWRSSRAARAENSRITFATRS